VGSRGIICERVKEVYNIKIKKVQQQQMLGEVRTVSKKEKRVREVRRK
jgi:hypothetical protein